MVCCGNFSGGICLSVQSCGQTHLSFAIIRDPCEKCELDKTSRANRNARRTVWCSPATPQLLARAAEITSVPISFSKCFQTGVNASRRSGLPLAERWLTYLIFNNFAGRVKISCPKPRAFFNSRSRSQGFSILVICHKRGQPRRKGKYQGETRRTPSRLVSIRGKSVP